VAAKRRTPIVAFTATRWGTLLEPDADWPGPPGRAPRTPAREAKKLAKLIWPARAGRDHNAGSGSKTRLYMVQAGTEFVSRKNHFMISSVAGAPRPQVDLSPASALPEGGSQRDPRGRFVKGNKGGPGNPYARRLAQFRKVLLDVVTDEDIQATAQKLLEQARAGDLAAIRLLFSYAIGKAAAAVDTDPVEVEEWQLMQEPAWRPRP
jgi:hypothetical protein